MADEYIGVREHHEAIGALKDEQARQREKTAALEMALLYQMNGIQRTLEDIKATVQRPPQDHAVQAQALATHRTLDTLTSLLERLSESKPSNHSPVLIAFALLGAVALGAFGMQFIGG